MSWLAGIFAQEVTFFAGLELSHLNLVYSDPILSEMIGLGILIIVL